MNGTTTLIGPSAPDFEISARAVIFVDRLLELARCKRDRHVLCCCGELGFRIDTQNGSRAAGLWMAISKNVWG
jgi:hypothetical protein